MPFFTIKYLKLWLSLNFIGMDIVSNVRRYGFEWVEMYYPPIYGLLWIILSIV